MSEQGTQAATTATNTVSADVVAETLKKMNERFTKRGKVISLSTDLASQAAISAMVDVLSVTKGPDGAEIANPKFLDWTVKAGEGFDNFALVRVDEDTSDNATNDHVGDIRLIAIANQEAALADLVVRNYLYRLYVNKVVNKATEDDAQEAEFILVNGAFKSTLAEDAFDEVAKPLLKVLHAQGVAGITKSSLKMAFRNAAFATTQFPRIKGDLWERIINSAKSFAAEKGLDTAIFDYWLTTRTAVVDSGKEIDLDLEALTAAFHGQETAPATPVPVQPTA